MDADSRSRRPVLPADQVDLAVEVFRMLSDATRIQLLWALIDRELSVNELADHVGKTPASVSQHLAKLRMTRLVHTRREGTSVFYRLENNHIAQLVTDAVYNADHATASVPDHHRPDADITALPTRSDEATS
ncbi:ArsR family transcriptional regulator [Geodermatophilus sp. Leaf369]|nr:metalloregulator ArsR/SmtB family transcription factor [Geodermatophilus sp. Leaf369]KQS54819.1 ArsR family transcriptional regulator [Geodermatophilus sp. Leaf369]